MLSELSVNDEYMMFASFLPLKEVMVDRITFICENYGLYIVVIPN